MVEWVGRWLLSSSFRPIRTLPERVDQSECAIKLNFPRDGWWPCASASGNGFVLLENRSHCPASCPLLHDASGQGIVQEVARNVRKRIQ